MLPLHTSRRITIKKHSTILRWKHAKVVFASVSLTFQDGAHDSCTLLNEPTLTCMVYPPSAVMKLFIKICIQQQPCVFNNNLVYSTTTLCTTTTLCIQEQSCIQQQPCVFNNNLVYSTTLCIQQQPCVQT